MEWPGRAGCRTKWSRWSPRPHGSPRPGGAIIGYDLTDTGSPDSPPGRCSPDRIIAADELKNGLVVVGCTEITVRPRFVGRLMRLHALKPTGG